MAKTTRKCRICGKEFNIYKDDYVHFKNGYVEVDCFKSYKLEKGISEDIIDIQLSELLLVSREEKRIRSENDLEIVRKKILSKNRENNRKENLNRLIKYLIDTYNVSSFPNYFYTRLAQINNGTFKGVKVGIPYEDLLDMFKRKQKNLDNIAFRNKKIGKDMVGINRINYDLAILINKYDEYLEWKNKQNVLSSSTSTSKQETKEIKIDYSKFKTNNEDGNNIDIGDILDDIY